jgi:hypothetical protein
MEENLIGYLLGALDSDAQREVADYLNCHPDEQVKLNLLRKSFEPLSSDRDAIDPPPELAMRTVALVAEHIVNSEGSVADPNTSSVADFLRTLHRTEPAASKPAAVALGPIYPFHGNEANPVQHRRRNIFALGGLCTAMLMIGVTAVYSIRQQREIQTCANNMRVIHQELSTYCDMNDNRFPKVDSTEDVRTTLAKVQQAGLLMQKASFTCAGVEHLPSPTMAPQQNPIDYAYILGYRDLNGNLWGLSRDEEHDLFPILADAPERRDGQAVPVNHRHGQNVLFASGEVRFCTTALVGPMIAGQCDDIYFNSVHEPRAGTHRLDTVLGLAYEKP